MCPEPRRAAFPATWFFFRWPWPALLGALQINTTSQECSDTAAVCTDIDGPGRCKDGWFADRCCDSCRRLLGVSPVQRRHSSVDWASESFCNVWNMTDGWPASSHTAVLPEDAYQAAHPPRIMHVWDPQLGQIFDAASARAGIVVRGQHTQASACGATIHFQLREVCMHACMHARTHARTHVCCILICMYICT